jgi:uncharacterized protein (DUF1697 family)
MPNEIEPDPERPAGVDYGASGSTAVGYVALLRGVNVAGHRPVRMADLRALVESLGHRDVSTYLQSGNVVFSSAFRDTDELAQEIASTLGGAVTVLVLPAGELASIVAANPFPHADTGHLHVTFLADAPEPARVAALDGDRFAPDAFRLLGRQVYVHAPNGYGRSKLGNAFFERMLGVAATTRNWRTVTALAGLAEDSGA